MRAASFFPLNYNETCLETGGGSVLWSDRAPCRHAQSEKLKGHSGKSATGNAKIQGSKKEKEEKENKDINVIGLHSIQLFIIYEHSCLTAGEQD